MNVVFNLRLSAVALLLLIPASCWSHDGPDPVFQWEFNRKNLDGKKLKARLGPDGQFNAMPRIITDDRDQSVRLNGRGMECVLAHDIAEIRQSLPPRDLTISAWVAIEKPEEYGAIIGCVQDNGGAEKGWLLGYRNRRFCFAAATAGSDDGDGMMTYLTAEEDFELGQIYHVVGTYDGKQMELHINGKLCAATEEQSGNLLYPSQATFVIGSYHDRNEFFPMTGRIREVSVYDRAAKPKWIKEEFEHNRALATLPPMVGGTAKHFIVKPYLQYGTQTAMTIAWRNAVPCIGTLHWGETIQCENSEVTAEKSEFAHIRLEGLQPNTQYFYWVETSGPDSQPIESDVSTFQTACDAGTPFAFAVISDTQHNPKVSGPIAELAWAKRPNFLLHSGDLVDQGKMSDDWIDEFFASMHPLISRVPFYPVLGNHEQNAKNYFDYMVLPEPEYYYHFSYGNADFFMIDTNRKVDPESEQFEWLDKALEKSQATWKFVCHHHPPFSSDENDYGDLWKTNKSTHGDVRVRALVPLYEKHRVDIVWTGHIHSYERTWPVRGNRAVNEGGTIYMITGGGGGGLEAPGPYRPFFQNNVRRGHHFTVVAINGTTLELKSFSLKDELFDSIQIEKKATHAIGKDVSPRFGQK